MITHSNDFNVHAIVQASGLQWDKDVTNRYKIFGNKSAGHKCIEITCNLDKDVNESIWGAQVFLKYNGISSYFTNTPDNCVSIGLRRDIRNGTDLSVAILKTIIYAYEGKLVIGVKDERKTFPFVPKFLDR